MTDILSGRYIQATTDVEKDEIISTIVMMGITPIISTIKYGLGVNFFEFDGNQCYFYSTKDSVKTSSAKISIKDFRDVTRKCRQETLNDAGRKAIDKLNDRHGRESMEHASGIVAPPKSFHNFVCEVAREKQLPAYSNVLGTNVLLSVVAEEAAKRFEQYVRDKA